MHRKHLLSLLSDYKPYDKQEIAFKDQMISFIQRYPDCFERSLALGHITASSWLLNQDLSKALLMHHTKLNLWLQLGGHCDGNPHVLEVAIKEAQEESGIHAIVPVTPAIFDIDIHLIPANKREQEHFHYDVRFLLKVTSNESVAQNHESKELRWINKHIHELPTTNSSIVRMHTKWLSLS